MWKLICEMGGNMRVKSLDAYDIKNKIGFEIKAKIIDNKNGIVLWEFNGNKWLMTPKENFKSFRIVKNNCETEKRKELDFLPIEY